MSFTATIDLKKLNILTERAQYNVAKDNAGKVAKMKECKICPVKPQRGMEFLSDCCNGRRNKEAQEPQGVTNRPGLSTK